MGIAKVAKTPLQDKPMSTCCAGVNVSAAATSGTPLTTNLVERVFIYLPHFLAAQVNFHESARRLFVGEVALQPSFQLEAGPPPRLVLNFSAAVNPTISTEPGRVRMVFKRDPIVSPASQSVSFDNKLITQATFAENNGVAELDVATTSPLLATFSNNGKTITLAPAPTAANAAKPVVPGKANPPSQPSPAPAASGNVAAARRLLAVLDPAHGGEERGAALTATLAEKDVALGLARLLRHELEARGFAVLLLRDADTTLTSDQRAGTANTSHAALYISLHATSQGAGVRAYTALLPVAP
jgi:N-acetylmuramoyl-L-alanine amidase